MTKTIALLALVIAAPAAAQTAAPAPAAANATPAAAQLSCTAGAVSKTYGGSPWTVHYCNDGHSIAIEADKGSKAAPCIFTMLYQSDGSYQAHGRCGGDKATTQAAFDEIGNLNAGQVKSLYDQAQPSMPQR
jgi:hypothetical protein